MKLAINLPMLVSWQAFGEAFAISRHLGIDPVRLVDIFSDSGGGTNALKGRAAVVAQMLGGDDTAPGTYDLVSCRKDLSTMLAKAKTRGVELPLVERAFACFDESNKAGWGARDSSSQAGSTGRAGAGKPREVRCRASRCNRRQFDAALKKGRETNCDPLTVAVLGTGETPFGSVCRRPAPIDELVQRRAIFTRELLDRQVEVDVLAETERGVRGFGSSRH